MIHASCKWLESTKRLRQRGQIAVFVPVQCVARSACVVRFSFKLSRRDDKTLSTFEHVYFMTDDRGQEYTHVTRYL